MLEIDKRVFAGCFSKEVELRVSSRGVLLKTLPFSVFTNEYHVLYDVIFNYPKINITDSFLKLYMITNRPRFEDTKQVDLSLYVSLDSEEQDKDTLFNDFVQSTLDVLEECMQEEVEFAEVESGVEFKKLDYLNMQTAKVLNQSLKIMSEGYKDKGELKVGYNAVRTYTSKEFNTLDRLFSSNKRRGIITYGVDVEEEREPARAITTWGIPSLDKALQAIYQGYMVSVVAPPKVGKSSFVVYTLHHAVVENGANIGIWSVENGFLGWEAKLRARHYRWYYNKHFPGEVVATINSRDIFSGNLSPELAELEEVSWNDLKTNPAYGKITNIDVGLTSETLIPTLSEVIHTRDVELLGIDYLQLITSTGNKTKTQAIGEAYQEVLALLKNEKVAAIIPAQLKTAKLDSISKLDIEELKNFELRDAGAESSEVLRTPDINMFLYGSLEDIDMGRAHLISMPSRDSERFDPIPLRIDYATNTFIEER